MSKTVKCEYCETFIGAIPTPKNPGEEHPRKEKVLTKKRRHEKVCSPK